jgi:hypothetical protein
MDNRSSENAEWDNELLGLELGDLLEAEFDLGLTGFTDEELSALMNGLAEDGTGAQAGEDEVPETPENPVSRPGDLWILGNHRLLCGDSTVATDVERLLGTVTPLLLVSDPPYGVEYDPSWRNHAGAAKTKRTGKVLNDDRADWREAWALFPGDVAYVWHGALHAKEVAESLEACGFVIRSQIIWVKGMEGFNRTSPVSGPTFVDATVGGKRLRRGARLWTVATSTFKAETYRFLRQDRPTPEEVAGGATEPPGTIHLPSWVDGEWLKQLVAEQLVTVRNKRGFAKLEWQKLRERNEALDCRVYARAAAWIVGADRWSDRHWQELERQLAAQETVGTKDASGPGKPRPVARRRAVRSSYMG